MKKRKVEILVTVILSLGVWIYFYLKSIPLTSSETILVVGVIFLIAYIIWIFIKFITKKQDEN